MRVLIGVSVLASLLGCDTEKGRHGTEGNDALALSVSIATWRDGKQCAVSLAFDDARESSFLIAAPLLENHEFRGTFFLNTGEVKNWTPWRHVGNRGHEIGNHTRDHLDLSEIPLETAEASIINGLRDLHVNMPRLSDIACFAYPYGRQTESLRDIVSNFHLASRGAYGLNPSDPKDFSFLAGQPYVSEDSLYSSLHHCQASRGWMIQYFHGIEVGEPDPIPIAMFCAYLDSLTALRDEIWIAPMGDVAKYVWARQHSKLALPQKFPGWVRVVSDCDAQTFDIPLTLVVQLGNTLLLTDASVGGRVYVDPHWGAVE